MLLRHEHCVIHTSISVASIYIPVNRCILSHLSLNQTNTMDNTTPLKNNQKADAGVVREVEVRSHT